MRKSDKKIDKALVKALTLACDQLQENSPGFVWLTHIVDYQHFPESLRIICVYQNDSDLNKLCVDSIQRVIMQHLESMSVRLKRRHRQILFESEQNCERVSNGNWRHHIENFLVRHS